MNEFSPPTLKHLCVFVFVFGAGLGYIIWYEVNTEPCFSLNRLLDNAVSVLILSTALTVIIVEGTTMFAEAWIERRRKRIQEEVLKMSEENLAKLLETRDLTKDDLPRLRQILSTDLTHKEDAILVPILTPVRGFLTRRV